MSDSKGRMFSPRTPGHKGRMFSPSPPDNQGGILSPRPPDNQGRMFSPRTIVGGRPPARPGIRSDVPRGIEVLLRKASVDEAFRGRLLTDFEAAARSIDLELAPGERAVLGSVTPAALSAMIARVEIPAEHRGVFKGRAAAAMLAIVAGTAFACSPPGIAPGGCVVQPEEQQEQPAEQKDAKPRDGKPRDGKPKDGDDEGIQAGERPEEPR